MSDIEQANLYEQNFWRAKFDDAAVKESISTKGIMVAMMGARKVPDHFVVKFGSENGSFGPLCLNRATAVMLHRLLGQEGFSS